MYLFAPAGAASCDRFPKWVSVL